LVAFAAAARRGVAGAVVRIGVREDSERQAIEARSSLRLEASPARLVRRGESS
jgi:hypothetical protein